MPYLLVAIMTSALAAGDPPGTMLERAARADALHRIFAQLATLPLVEGVPLVGWPGWDGEQEARLREKALAACVFANFQIEADGRARVLATLPLAAVQIEEAGWPRLVGGVLIAVGRADPRVAGVDAPEGWEHTTARGRVLAELAARENLRERLLAGALQAAAERGVNISETDLKGRIATLWELGPTEYLPTQLCRTTGRVDLEKLLPGLALSPRTTTVDSPGAPPPVEIVASAHGTTPWMGLWTDAAIEAEPPPSWAGRRLRATGRGAGSPAAPDAVARSAAEKAARIDALMKMAREVDRLPLAGEFASVRAYIVAHPEDDDAWTAFLQSGRTVEASWQNAVSQVTIEWDLGTLWGLVRTE